MIQDNLKNEMKEAMKARDEVRLRTIRSLLSAFTNELVATQRKPTETLPDEDALKVIKRASSQHKDSIEQFEKGNRPQLAAIVTEHVLGLSIPQKIRFPIATEP